MMEVEWINAVWMWRLRAIGSIFFASISVALLVLSLARLFDVNIVNWPEVALWLIEGYGQAVVWVLFKAASLIEFIGFRLVAQWVRDFPVRIFDFIAAYVFVGSVVRLSEVWTILRSEKKILDLGPDHIRDRWAEISFHYRFYMACEGSKKYLLWPARVFSDIKDGHFHLSPTIGGGLLLLTLILLWVATWSF